MMSISTAIRLSQMDWKDALRNASDRVAEIEALWQSTPPRTCVNGIRLPVEVRELAQVTHLLLAVVGQQQEVMAAQQQEIAKLKARFGS